MEPLARFFCSTYLCLVTFQERARNKISKAAQEMIQDLTKNITTLKHLIEIKDEELLHAITKNLKTSEHAGSLSFIIKALEKAQYDDALLLIDEFLSQSRQVVVKHNPIVAALKIELHLHDGELNLIAADRDDIIKKVDHFHTIYQNRLGDLLERVLYLRKEKLAMQAINNPAMREKYEAAKKEYEEFLKIQQSPIIGIFYTLEDKELRELKRLYRKACLICHPDRVAEEDKENAKAIFEELHEAYSINDIKKVRLIAELLEKTGKFEAQFEKMDDAEVLQLQIERILIKIEETEEEISDLKASQAYQTVNSIKEEWDVYFERLGENLKAQIKELNTWLSLHSIQN